jgi:hypothetical protein
MCMWYVDYLSKYIHELAVDMHILGYITTSVTSDPNIIKFIFLLTSYLSVFHTFQQIHKV